MSRPQIDMPHHRRVFAGFFLYSIVLAALYSRIAEIQQALGVGKAALGLGLLGAPLGTQLALIFAARFVERLGQRDTVLYGVPMMGIFLTLASLAPSITLFALALFFAGLAIGALEIVLNLEADRAEHLLGRRVMSRAHAFWSFGFFAAGMIGAIAAQLQIEPWLHLGLSCLLASAALWPLYAPIIPAPGRDQQEAPGPRFVLPTAAILLLVVVTLPAMLLEGASIDWSVIYMRESFDVSPFVNGMGLAFAAGFQALTRYLADPVVDRFGPVKVAQVLLSLLGLGCLVVVLAPVAWLALLGFALIGIGSSSIFPLAMSAAAQRKDRRAAVNVAALAQLSFVVFLMAPPLLGMVAEWLGIRLAFGLGLPLVGFAFLYVSRLDPRHG